MEFLDAHMHVWATNCEGAVHDCKVLGDPSDKFPKYYFENLKSDLEVQSSDFIIRVVGAVHIEAIPSDGWQEVLWVAKQARDASFPVAIVGRLDLSMPDACDQLEAWVAQAQEHNISLKGIRFIVNWEPTWPKVQRSDYLSSSTFARAYAALGENDLSFDLQANPHQLLDAAHLAKTYPKTRLIINHMGCLSIPTLPLMSAPSAYQQQQQQERANRIAVWRQGMRALAEAGDHVFVKISMMCYIDPNWDQDDDEVGCSSKSISHGSDSVHKNESYHPEYALLQGSRNIVPLLVSELVSMFGPHRCMFASNFPVDKASGFSGERLLRGFTWLCDKLNFSEDVRRHLFSGTARRCYNF
eukprot:gene313-3682_t